MIGEIASGQRLCGSPDVYADTRIIPGVSASQRYDSNVFYTPPEFLPPDRKAWDWVSTISPDVEVVNKNRLAETSVKAGVAGNLFVNNPELNFISTTLLVNSDLSGWIGNLIRGAKLQVSEYFQYTPEPPGFLTGVDPKQTGDAFSRGIVAFRANTFTNYASVVGSYELTRTLGIQASYVNSIFRVGQFFSSQPSTGGTLFTDSIVHNVSVGPTYKLTRGDSVSAFYEPIFMSLSGTGGGSSQSFTAHGVVAEYSRATPSLTVTIKGGATLLEQGDRVFFAGRLTVLRDYGPSTRMRITASRDVGPAFFGTGGALLSTTVGISLEHQVARALLVEATANYAQNNAVPVKVVEWESFLTGVRLTYKLTRTLSTSVAYDYNYFDIRSGTPTTLQSFLFDKHVVTFSIGAKWK